MRTIQAAERRSVVDPRPARSQEKTVNQAVATENRQHVVLERVAVRLGRPTRSISDYGYMTTEA
jgi:hypothetical protein